jgi:hypothetical protein
VEVSSYGEMKTKCQYIVACNYYDNLSYDKYLAQSNTIILQTHYETWHGTEYPNRLWQKYEMLNVPFYAISDTGNALLTSQISEAGQKA